MSVKNIFFTDDNQLDFKIGDEDVSKIFCGDVLVWERGEDYGNKDRIEYVKGFTSPVNGVLKNTSYEAGDISDECEMAYVSNGTTPSQVTIDPKRPCLAILAVFINTTNYEQVYNTTIKQGWSYVKNVTCGPWPNETDTRCLAIFSRKMTGGMVYGSDYKNNGGGATGIALLYGAESVNVVQHGNLLINTTYTCQIDQSTERTYYGFTTAEPTNKNRVYVIARAATSSSMPDICTDNGDLPTLTGIPNNYIFSISNLSSGFASGRININYDNQNNNEGITWFTEYKNNPSPSYEPETLNTVFATVVLDVNYD